MSRKIRMMLGVLVVAACASSQPSGESQSAPPSAEQRGMGGGMMHHGMADMCPMQVAGTSVRTEDVEGGVAIAFSTTGDVAELRRRVAHMVEMHDRSAGGGRQHGMAMHGHQGSAAPGHHHHGSPPAAGGQAPGRAMGGPGMSGPRMPAADARSEDVEGGARMVLTPRDPTELTALREHTRQMAERMATGECPMTSAQTGHGGSNQANAGSQESHRPEGGD